MIIFITGLEFYFSSILPTHSGAQIMAIPTGPGHYNKSEIFNYGEPWQLNLGPQEGLKIWGKQVVKWWT